MFPLQSTNSEVVHSRFSFREYFSFCNGEGSGRTHCLQTATSPFTNPLSLRLSSQREEGKQTQEPSVVPLRAPITSTTTLLASLSPPLSIIVHERGLGGFRFSRFFFSDVDRNTNLGRENGFAKRPEKEGGGVITFHARVVSTQFSLQHITLSPPNTNLEEKKVLNIKINQRQKRG